MTGYLETSFVAPFYLPEPTSSYVETFLGCAPLGTLAISYWTNVEFASLLARDVRMGNINLKTARRVQERFLQDAEFYQVLSPTSEDFQEAMRLLLPHTDLGLRGPDAFHLAIAKRRGLTLYTLDKPLLRAAEALGVPASDAGIGAL